MFAYGTEAGHVRANPARDVRYLPPKHKEGWHSWTDAEIKQFRERHPCGTPARLAVELLLNTGQRKSEVIKFGRRNIKGAFIEVLQHKNRKRSPVLLQIPLLPELHSELRAL